MQIISRAEAKASGLKRYFTGKPCKHGHVAERATVNGLCHECSRLKQLRNYHADREGNLLKQKIAREKPGYYEKRKAYRHRKDPALAAKVALREKDLAARENARRIGLGQYESPRPCGKGHIGTRFVNDGHCVECNKINCRLRFGFLGRFADRNPEIASVKAAMREARAERKRVRDEDRARQKERAKVWHAARFARQAAFAGGDKTYLGKICQSGHNGLRYTIGGGCVECASILAKSQAKKEYDAAYVQRNLTRILARSREYYRNNPEKVAKQAKDWIRRNPEKVKAIKMANKAKRRAIEKDGDPTSVIFAWVQSAKKVCHWCGTKCKAKYHVDHYRPLSKGGRHEVSNLVIACPPCNLRKSAKDPYEFAASVGRLF
jgi:5-methylcytosine-specific restriction endonuclease McrA